MRQDVAKSVGRTWRKVKGEARGTGKCRPKKRNPQEYSCENKMKRGLIMRHKIKKYKQMLAASLFVTALALLTLGCGSDGSGGGDPEPYLKFSGEGYGTYEWTEGFSDYGDGVPAGSIRSADIRVNFIALKTMTTSAAFNKNSIDHVCILLTSIFETTFTPSMNKIYMRVDTGSEFELNSSSVVLTKVTANYIKGTFTGETSGITIKGSFLFKRMPNGSWPLLYPL